MHAIYRLYPSMSVIFATQFSIEKTKRINNKYSLIVEKSLKI